MGYRNITGAISLNYFLSLFFFGIIAIFFLMPVQALAYEVKTLSVDVEKDDFVLEPAKVEIFLDPGGSETKILKITNRTKETKDFVVEIEDFRGTQDPNESVRLLGEEEGPYSLKDYLIPEAREFTLLSGQQILLPIETTIPDDAEPGGLYGSILISSASAGETGSAGAVSVSRLGALIFVRVSGEVEEEGFLDEFRIAGGKNFYTSGENMPDFELFFKNEGSVHLNVYGTITVTNIAGVVVDEIEIQPYFAMPDSLRYRNIGWGRDLLMGRYKAVASINRGYDDIVDEKSLTVWVMPWKNIFLVVGGILVLLFVVRWIGRTFKFELKKKD